jgi:hypothetical protein
LSSVSRRLGKKKVQSVCNQSRPVLTLVGVALLIFSADDQLQSAQGIVNKQQFTSSCIQFYGVPLTLETI